MFMVKKDSAVLKRNSESFNTLINYFVKRVFAQEAQKETL